MTNPTNESPHPISPNSYPIEQESVVPANSKIDNEAAALFQKVNPGLHVFEEQDNVLAKGTPKESLSDHTVKELKKSALSHTFSTDSGLGSSLSNTSTENTRASTPLRDSDSPKPALKPSTLSTDPAFLSSSSNESTPPSPILFYDSETNLEEVAKKIFEMVGSSDELERGQIRIEFNGKMIALNLIEELGQGQSGVVYRVHEIGTEILSHLGETFVLKTIKEELDKDVKIKAQEELVAGYNLHIHLREGDPHKKIPGIQDITHFATSNGQTVQFSRLYEGGDLNDLTYFKVDTMQPEEAESFIKCVYGMFSTIIEGHIFLKNHNLFQSDSTLSNYYSEKPYYTMTEDHEAQFSKEDLSMVCIGDLDSCYNLVPDQDLEGKLYEGLRFPTPQTTFKDFNDFMTLIKKHNGSFDQNEKDLILKQLKELSEKMIVFSTGTLLFELTTGYLPYRNKDLERSLNLENPERPFTPVAIDHEDRYPQINQPPPSNLKRNADPFIIQMLKPDPKDRPSLESVYKFLSEQK